jgi:hypothetical protein
MHKENGKESIRWLISSSIRFKKKETCSVDCEKIKVFKCLINSLKMAFTNFPQLLNWLFDLLISRAHLCLSGKRSLYNKFADTLIQTFAKRIAVD